jgi:hypothetical protein
MKHKNIQIKPCKVDWYAMEADQDGNRFCQNCNKVVHDMSEMSEAEADAFLNANPGSCGNFLASQIDAVPNTENKIFATVRLAKSAAWKKAAAAAAAFALLHGTMPADLLNTELNEAAIERLLSDPPTIGPSTNTLLTGVLVSDNGHAIRDLITMQISCGNKLVDFPVTVENGLFMVDLSAKLLPSDTIEIIIPEQSSRSAKYPKTTFKTTLGDGQNLNIPIAVQYTRRTGGVMVRPR